MVKLISILKKYISSNNQKDEVILFFKSPIRIADVIKELKIPSNIHLLILKNGRYANIDTELQDNDQITLLPPVAGG
jgi:molybdopterin converting factor small subunit